MRPDGTTDPAGRRAEAWYLWSDGPHPADINMALDDALLEQAPRTGRPILRFYEWDRPSISIGYVQRFPAEFDGLDVVRRPTGGGIVHHDHDLTYTVVLPAGHWLTGLDRTKSYDCINKAVLAGLARCQVHCSLAEAEIPSAVDRKTMVCFSNPTRYDILMQGRKIAGSAQRRRRTGILHQGSIHFGQALPMQREEMRAHIREGFEDEVGAVFDSYAPDEDLLTLAERLVQTTYGRDDWNRRR